MFQTSFWDRFGIGLSGFCAIHCLFFPVVMVLLPLWPVTETIHSWTHPILFLFIVPTVIYALRKPDVPRSVPRLLYSGLTIIAMAWLLHNWVGTWMESVITMVGSALLIAGHWFNYKYHLITHKKSEKYETA